MKPRVHGSSHPANMKEEQPGKKKTRYYGGINVPFHFKGEVSYNMSVRMWLPCSRVYAAPQHVVGTVEHVRHA